MRLFNGINSPEDVKRIDPDSFRFHGPMKALFYKMLHLINPPPKEWLDKMVGNNAIYRDIYYEYLENERQEWRRENFIRVIPFVLCLMEDQNYAEIFEWMLYRVHQEYEKGNIDHNPMHLFPHCWFQDARKCRELSTPKENLICMRMNDGKK